MIIRKKVEVFDKMYAKNHKYSPLDKPVEVKLARTGAEWYGRTDMLK